MSTTKYFLDLDRIRTPDTAYLLESCNTPALLEDSLEPLRSMISSRKAFEKSLEPLRSMIKSCSETTAMIEQASFLDSFSRIAESQRALLSDMCGKIDQATRNSFEFFNIDHIKEHLFDLKPQNLLSDFKLPRQPLIKASQLNPLINITNQGGKSPAATVTVPQIKQSNTPESIHQRIFHFLHNNKEKILLALIVSFISNIGRLILTVIVNSIGFIWHILCMLWNHFKGF